MPRTALVFGATGLVGKQLLRLLLADPDYASVAVAVRKPISAAHPKLVQIVVDFGDLGATDFPAGDDVFCGLGTTIRIAGSQAAFRKVDYDAIVSSAASAQKAGGKQFLLISAMGANAQSRVFYSRVKGETEDSVAAMPWRACLIFRPSMIEGDRPDRKADLGGITMTLIRPFMKFIPLKYRPIPDIAIARAMIAFAKRDLTGRKIIESDAMQPYAATA